MSSQGNTHPAIDAEQFSDERRCTTFTLEHGLTTVPDEFVFAFICTGCEKPNALRGDPREFRGKLFHCMQCPQISLLDAPALDQFIAEEYDGG